MAYSDNTLATRLAAVQAAIEAILTGAQSYSLGGRTLTRASLAELIKLEKRLEARIRSAARGGKRNLADFTDATSNPREV